MSGIKKVSDKNSGILFFAGDFFADLLVFGIEKYPGKKNYPK